MKNSRKAALIAAAHAAQVLLGDNEGVAASDEYVNSMKEKSPTEVSIRKGGVSGRYWGT